MRNSRKRTLDIKAPGKLDKIVVFFDIKTNCIMCFLGSKKRERPECLAISRPTPFIFIKLSLFYKIDIGFKSVYISRKCFNELCPHNCKHVTI